MAENRSLSAYVNRGNIEDITPEMAQHLAAFRGQYRDLPLTSGYRDPATNRRVGGAGGSQHMHGNAFDFSLKGLDENQKREVVNWWRQRGATGVGYYPGSDSVHVDFAEGGNRAWGPNYSHTSLGQTPRWFQEVAAEHRSGPMPRARNADDDFFSQFIKPEPRAAARQADAPAPVMGSNGQPLPEVTVRPRPEAAASDDDFFKGFMRPEADKPAPAADQRSGLRRFGEGVVRGGTDVINTFQNLEAAAAPRLANKLAEWGIISRETAQQGAEAQQNALLGRTAERDAFNAANPSTVAETGPLSYVPSLSGLGRGVGQAIATAPAAVPAGAAMGALAPGAAVAGRAAPYINALMQGASGGAVGAAGASAQSDAPLMEQIGQGATGGAIAGPLFLGATNLARGATNGLIERLSPTARAANQITDNLAQSGATPQSVGSQLAGNPRLNLADVDPTLLATGQGLVRNGGQARTTIDQAISARQLSRPGEARDIFERTLGAAPDPVVLRDRMASIAQQNAQRGFGDAMANAKPVDVSNALAHIDAKINPSLGTGITPSPRVIRLQEIRRELADAEGNIIVNPQRLHEIQSALGAETRSLKTSASSAERQLAPEVEAVRQQIVNSIDSATGGRYRPAQRQFAQDMEMREAFDLGRDAFRNGRDQHPSEIRAALNALPAPAQAAYRAGALVHMNDMMGQTRNAARTGAAIPESQFGRDKLEILFGKDKAAEISRLFRDETSMMRTNNLLTGGSQTALREGAAEGVRPRNVPSFGQSVGMGSLGPLAMGAGFMGESVPTMALGAAGSVLGLGRMGYQAAGRRLDLATNNRLAQMLTSQGPERDAVLNMLMQRSAPRQIQESVNPLLGSGLSNAAALQFNQRGLVPQP